MLYNMVKKVAAIHDLSGLGRCSLTAAIPILSVLGVQACPFPTAILSCQTGYDNFTFLDMTDEMKKIKRSWDANRFDFDGIYTGFLGSEKQIKTVIEFIEAQPNSYVIVDPVMGDNGEVYKTYSKDMCTMMKELVRHADVVTPNLTESCILTDKSYNEITFDEDIFYEIAKEICALGPKKVVITGVVHEERVYNFAYDLEEDNFFFNSTYYNGMSYSGTGDVFASILCGLLMKGNEFDISVMKAVKFIEKAIRYTTFLETDERNGICFEPILKDLIM